MTTFRVRVDQCRFPVHDLDVRHIWPAQPIEDRPICVSRLDSGEWFVQDGRHTRIRAQLCGVEWVAAVNHDDGGCGCRSAAGQ